MSMSVLSDDRIAMSQRERDVLKVLHTVQSGQRTQAEAARLLGLCVRQVRRLQRKLDSGGDGALIHRLRGGEAQEDVDSQVRRRWGRAGFLARRLLGH
jgi:hypothetical protein